MDQRAKHKMTKMTWSSRLIVMFFIAYTCMADFDNVQDVCPTDLTKKQSIFINGFPCKNPATVSTADFKSNKLSKPGSPDIFGASETLVTAAEFPGLNTLGLSIARTDLDIDGLVSLQSHPRASKMIFVFKGTVLYGFLDTKNQLFQKSLKEGDVFVVPRGLLHFCLNNGFEVATIFSVLNSQNPGVIGTTTFSKQNVDSLDKPKRRLMSLSDAEVHPVSNLTMEGLGLESLYG